MEEQVLIEVKFDESTVKNAQQSLRTNLQQVQANKKELAELNKTLKEHGELNEQQTKRYAELTKEIEENKRAIKSNTALINAATSARATENDSLDVQRQYLNTLQKAFAGLTKEQKEAMGGQEALEKAIKAVSDSLKEQEEAIGETGRNVGNYTESMMRAFGEMAHAGELMSPAVSLLRGMGKEGQEAAAVLDSLSKVMQLAGKASKVFAASRQAEQVATEGATVAQEGLNAAMNANPIGLIIAGISTLLPLVQKMINSFTDASKYVEQFNNELERQNQIIEQSIKDAEFESKVAGVMGKSAQEQLNIRRKAALQAEETAQANVDKLLEIKRNGSRKERKAAEEALVNAEQQLKDAQARVSQLNQESTLQNLRDLKAAEDEKLKIQEEGAKKRSDAKKKELEERNKLERELAIQQMEDMRLLAEAEAATAAAQSQQLADEAKAMLENLVEGEDEEEDTIPTPEEQALRLGLDQEGLDYYKSLLDQGIDANKAFTMAMSDQWKRNADGVLKIMHNIGDGFQAMGDLMGNFAEESEVAAAAQKAFTLIGILTNQAASISAGALAIAEGVASAAAVPFPANIPAIISVTATITSLIAGVASSIAQAKQLFSQAKDAGNFATGGIVGGTSYTGDKMTAHVNSREMILPLDAQKNLFDALTSNSDGERQLGIDYGLVADAMASLPPDTLVLTELREAQDNVSQITKITEI